MASTTIKVSTETRDRLKELGRDTYEDAIVEMLDKAEEEEFWAQADRAKAWLDSLPEERRRAIRVREEAVDALFDGIE